MIVWFFFCLLVNVLSVALLLVRTAERAWAEIWHARPSGRR